MKEEEIVYVRKYLCMCVCKTAMKTKRIKTICFLFLSHSVCSYGFNSSLGIKTNPGNQGFLNFQYVEDKRKDNDYAF